MASEDIVTDPVLRSVLQSAARAREQSLAIIDLLDSFGAPAAGEDVSSSQTSLSRQQKLLTTHLAQLRSLNRKAVLGVRDTKSSTAEARTEIDNLHLQLQNLYYEQRHLHGEIAACQDYKHTYADIPMVPVEEFIALHPEYETSNEHDITVARIEDEHARRQALEEQKQALVKKKEGLRKEVGARKEELNKLDAEMEKWVKSQDAVAKVFEARQKKLSDEAEKTRG